MIFQSVSQAGDYLMRYVTGVLDYLSTFQSVYRISFYLMLFFATLTMNVDAIDSEISMLFPVATAVACLLALVTVDRNPRLGLSRPLAYGLLVIALSLSVLEYRIEVNIVLTLAHFLVYLQIVKVFLPKKAEDDWLLYGLGVMQVLVGSMLSQSDRVGMLLVTWAMLAIWVLGLFALDREAARAQRDQGGGTSAGPVVSDSFTAAEPYPGLFSPGFLFSAFRVMMTTLALGGVIFMLLPRRAASGRAQGVSNPTQHMTGFDDEVQLGQLGEILESDSVVMSVELYDGQGRRQARREEAMLWRGVTLEEYQAGRWHRQARHNATLPNSPKDMKTHPDVIVQRIKLEPTDANVLFGLRPMFEVKVTNSGRFDPEINSLDGTIFRTWTAPHGGYDYEVVSRLDTDLTQPGESQPFPERLLRAIPDSVRRTGLSTVPPGVPQILRNDVKRLQRLLEVPDKLRPHLQSIAQPIVAALPPDDMVARARALEHYLRDSGRFTYSLHMGTVDEDLDPVEDFLVNRKEGHCEYFASALTLLLRSIGIPARMVNGFKGGDWNELALLLSVRQKHAHSWVEAYQGAGPDHTVRWLTLDPTPTLERERSVARVGGFGRNLRQLTDLIRYFWVFYIVGFNAERQQTLLYDPIHHLMNKAADGFTIMGGMVRSAISELIYFQNARQFISWRGFAVSFTGLLLLVLLFRGGFWCARRTLRWYRGGNENDAGLAAGVLFYRRLALLLAEYGLERTPAETQHEFARRATVFLAGRGPEAATVVDVPRQVADAFYRVRFGRREIAPADLSQLESRLDALEARLRAEQD